MRERKEYLTKLGGVFDTHAHLYDERYVEEGVTPSEVLRISSEVGVTRVLIPADSIESSMAALEYVKANNGVCGVQLYAAVGIHPHEASSWSMEAREKLLQWLDPSTRRDNRIYALGEIGLDYHYDLSPRDVQREAFYEQMVIAYELDIPIILHEREAAGDCMDILRRLKAEGKLRTTPGVCHCCSCSPEIATELVKLGFYIGFDGPITFKNNKNTPAVCEIVPLDRIVVETDSPYLTPEPNRGCTNIPSQVNYVIEKIASIKGVTLDQMVSITTENGLRLYEIE